MSKWRLLLPLLGVLAAAAALFVFLEVRVLGFPDGHLTELERAQQPLHYAFVIASILVACAALWYTWIARSRPSSRLCLLGWLSYGVLVAVFLSIDHWLALTLNSGTGG